MQLPIQNKTIMLGAFLLFSSAIRADLIFKDGFDSTEAEINCPNAMMMSELTSSGGVIFYSVEDVINPAGNKDYFTVPIQDDEWFQIFTSANPNNNSGMIDTVISVYNSDGSNLLAQNNDAIPRLSPDSKLTYHAIISENLCIKVEDVSTFSNSTPEGGPTFSFELIALPVDFFALDEFNLDLEPNDTIISAQTDLSTEQTFDFQEYTQIAGLFNDDTDNDNYELMTPSDTVTARITTTPSGNTGHGGTTDIGFIDIIASNGIDVISRINPTLGGPELYVPLQPNSKYYIQTNNPIVPIGENPFYFIKWSTQSSQNQQETDNSANNLSTGAEVANELPSSFATRHFIGGTLEGLSDIDWWSFQADAGDKINLFCSSWYVGSGVRDATFSIYENPLLAPLQSETEVESNSINWSNNPGSSNPEIAVVNSTTHYLAIDASSFSQIVIGRQYTCGIHVLHP